MSLSVDARVLLSFSAVKQKKRANGRSNVNCIIKSCNFVLQILSFIENCSVTSFFSPSLRSIYLFIFKFIGPYIWCFFLFDGFCLDGYKDQIREMWRGIFGLKYVILTPFKIIWSSN
jgi:hypothetical protein